MHNMTVENFTIVGLAMLKMLSFFWPVVLLIAYFMYINWRKEQEERLRDLEIIICSKDINRMRVRARKKSSCDGWE
jgi:hypothetical protein